MPSTNMKALLALQNQNRGPATDPQANPVGYGLDALTQIINSTSNMNVGNPRFGPGNTSDVGMALQGLASGWGNVKQNQNRSQFLNGVSQIAQSQESPDSKINLLTSLVAQHGQDYGLGINDIIKQYGEQAKTQKEGWKPTTQQQALDFETAKAGLKGEKTDPKVWERFSDALDPSKSVRTAFGISKITYDKAERLQSLANAYPDGNLDSRQIEELAIGFNSLLQGGQGGGGGGSERVIQSLVPRTYVGNAMKIAEWLTNNPQGTNQQEFVKRMMGTVEREKATTGAQIKRTQFQRVAAFSKLENTDPEQFTQVLLSQGIDPQEYQDWKAGGYKPINAAQAGISQPDQSAGQPQANAGQSMKSKYGLR